MWSRWQCLLSWGHLTWVCIVRVGAKQAGIIASSCWNPYSSCLKTWTLNHYLAMILCTFLIEIYGMFCLRFIFFLCYCFHYFCSSLNNLFYFKCRDSLILHCCVVMNYVGTKRQQCYSISLWKQKPRDKTQRTMFWFIYAYVKIFIYIAYAYIWIFCLLLECQSWRLLGQKYKFKFINAVKTIWNGRRLSQMLFVIYKFLAVANWTIWLGWKQV